MTLAFIKYYNPAYDFLILRYLGEGGIRLDTDVSFDTAIQMVKILDKKPELSPYEKALRRYVEAWKLKPERRPTGRILLLALNDIEPSPSELLRLQETLPQNVGKLILSEEDVAAEIAMFYRGFFAESLAKDLETGVPRSLYPYIEPNDDSRLDKARRFGPARYEEELRKFCQQLLSSLAGVTQKAVLDNIDDVFEEHLAAGDHMKKPSWDHGPSPSLICRHATQVVTLRGIVSKAKKDVSLTLVPSRGDPLCHAKANIPSFPWFEVVDLP